MNYDMHFTPEFYIQFYQELKIKFSNEWPDSVDVNSNLKVWQLTVEDSKNYSKLPLAKRNKYLTEHLFDVNERYFYQRYLSARKKSQTVVKDVCAIKCFRYLSCKGKNIFELRDSFIAKYSIPETVSSLQQNFDSKNTKLLKN